MRSPACGSPETSSTRSLSRTPSIETTARLLTGVSSSSSGEASISTMFGPACGIGICASARFVRARRCGVRSTSPSRRIVTCGRLAGAPWSSTRKAMVCGWPTMPKRGARYEHDAAVALVRLAGDSAWTGASKPSAAASAGTSCTRPSVMKIAPATRSGGTSASDGVERGEQPRAVGLAVGLAGLDDAHLEARDAAEPFGQLRARGLGLLLRARRSSGSGSCRRRRRRPTSAARGPRA